MQQSAISNQQSARIVSLRFLLIVFVVFIHNDITQVNFVGETTVYSAPLYVTLIKTLFSGILACVAVPLFFLISGYLLYVKNYPYKILLKKKLKTLLLPYIIWNILCVLFFFIGQSISFTKPFFANPQNIIRDFTFLDWIDVFCGKFTSRAPYPMVYQFWFLRDLIILNLISPVLKKLVDKFSLSILFLFIIFWISNTNLYIISPEALLFFTLGYYAVKHQYSIERVDEIRFFDIMIIYITTICLELFFAHSYLLIHKFNIILGCIFWLKMSKILTSNQKLFSVLKYLSGYSFWLYAFHEPFLTVLKKLSVKIIPMHGGFILIQYFGVAILGIFIAVLAGIVVKKIAKPVFNLLTGGRN